MSNSDDEDASILEKTIVEQTNPEDQTKTMVPETQKEPETTPESTSVEEYVFKTSNKRIIPTYQPTKVETPSRKIEERTEARRYVPCSELLYDLNYIVNKINQNVGLTMYNAMVKEGLVKRYRY